MLMRILDVVMRVASAVTDLTYMVVVTPRLQELAMAVELQQREVNDDWMTGTRNRMPWNPDPSVAAFAAVQGPAILRAARPVTFRMPVDECAHTKIKEYTAPVVCRSTAGGQKIRETGRYRRCEDCGARWLKRREQSAFHRIEPQPAPGARAPTGPAPKAKPVAKRASAQERQQRRGRQAMEEFEDVYTFNDIPAPPQSWAAQPQVEVASGSRDPRTFAASNLDISMPGSDFGTPPQTESQDLLAAERLQVERLRLQLEHQQLQMQQQALAQQTAGAQQFTMQAGMAQARVAEEHRQMQSAMLQQRQQLAAQQQQLQAEAAHMQQCMAEMAAMQQPPAAVPLPSPQVSQNPQGVTFLQVGNDEAESLGAPLLHVSAASGEEVTENQWTFSPPRTAQENPWGQG